MLDSVSFTALHDCFNIIVMSGYSNYIFFLGLQPTEPYSIWGWKVLAKAAHHLGLEEISTKYLQEGRLAEILIPEDYQPIQNVSHYYTLLVA